MKSPIRMQHLTSALFFALFWIVGAAHAKDFYMNTSSARSAGIGGIYVASSSDALDALAANPAGIAFLQGRDLNLAADAVFARAVAAGASPVHAVEDQSHGWREGRVVDPFGHHWEIGKPLAKM